MILEPVMMNAGIIPPDDGYLAGLRDLLHAHGALLAFDEVKTGFTAGPGGVTAMYGVTPDIVCLAKALGGGISVAAIGGTDEVMGAIADGRYEQVGTFNGNPLAMAAARATLTEVLTPRRTRTSTRCATRLRTASLEAIIAEHGLRLARRRRRRQGLRDVPRRPGPRLPRLPARSTTDSATCTGSCSTTAASSCRPGARSSSGCSRSSTTRPTSTGSSPTSRVRRRRWHPEPARTRR